MKFIQTAQGMAQVANDPTIEHIKHQLVQTGQELLIAGGVVIGVACGILIAIGLKREGFQRFLGIIQGYAVGLIGPTVLTGVAAFFIVIAKTLGS